MIWPSGLLSGSDIFSTRRAMMRLTATSSGASTSRARLPETSRTRMRVEGMAALSGSGRGDGRRRGRAHDGTAHAREEPLDGLVVDGVVLLVADLDHLRTDLEGQDGLHD